ncbi:MAG: PTS sugar transporter subunit IIB [Sporolactobacillus sp.]|jgi:mannose/fructose/N-acetylgalactosamine-specific phosphotransferase system component IIB|nr:PTS sugar transporter subunit IIB [Sporolactobacillus sp.]
MGKINLARVDDRLIHGQVMTKWSKGHGTNALYVVDDATAADEFMKQIYSNVNSSANLRVEVYSISEAIDRWHKDQFGKDNVILLFKSIESAKRIIDQGDIPIKTLNVGGIAKKPGTKSIINSVGLSTEDAERLKEIASKDIEIFFQMVPDSRRVSYESALKAFD